MKFGLYHEEVVLGLQPYKVGDLIQLFTKLKSCCTTIASMITSLIALIRWENFLISWNLDLACILF